MTSLNRRLTVLEQLAEDARRREWRALVKKLPEARGLSPAELEDAVSEALAAQEQIDAMKRAGVSAPEIMRRYANDLGVSVAELEAECAAIMAK